MMADPGKKRPPATGGKAASPRHAGVQYATATVETNLGAHGPISPIARQTSMEHRLAAKAAQGDRREYTGLSLDKMSREERHKLLYDE